MFAPVTERASPSTSSTPRHAAASALIEMMQIKGNSEVHRWFWR